MILRQGKGGVFLNLPWGRASGFQGTTLTSLCGARAWEVGTYFFPRPSGGRRGESWDGWTNLDVPSLQMGAVGEQSLRGVHGAGGPQTQLPGFTL